MVKPDIDQISAYMLERQFIEEDQPEAFYDYFESNGWKVGKNQMKNWQAAVRTWIRNTTKWSKRNETTNQYKNNNSFADRQRQQANQARTEIQQAQLGLYPDNVRPLRSVG